ncbi:transglutaminase-like domain-containing protein [Tumidithrix helvetica]|uniref:transglutaminase-like domain-containing protein n=1 Tax=Tumidithrix helvetica TaxID=3457545 RepID=UPI003CC509CB
MELAKQIASQNPTELEVARTSFEWVRDRIHHSSDCKMNPLTCRASDVLKYQTGYCFAKSHLLAALLRANHIPTGFCYQRLSVFDNGAPYSLHGFNALYLKDFGWYRVDARGNRQDVDAQFAPPQEKLAYRLQFPEEADFQEILAEPLPVVVRALQTQRTWDELLQDLPDLPLEAISTYGLTVRRREYSRS